MKKTLLTSAGLTAAMLSASFAGTAQSDLDASLLKKDSFADRFSFGSYGEIHGRFFKDGGTEVDPHRIVLFANYQFTDNLKFVSETELEHSLRKSAGKEFSSKGVKLELEQAYLEYAAREDLTAKAGLLLTPVGVINEIHEPTTFYGVERPNVETQVLPSTWTELGIGVTKTYDSGLQLDGVLHTGLDAKGGSIRGGRSSYGIDLFTVNSEENRFNVNNDSWAATTRAKYTGIAGVELAGTLQFQSDMDSSVSGDQDGILASTHGIYRKGGFQFIALASAWEIDVQGAGDSQWGYYLEPSYAWDTAIGKVGVFGRFSQYETAELKASSTAKEKTEYTVGANYWINDHLVVKADYLTVEEKGKQGGTDSYNVGFGWFF